VTRELPRREATAKLAFVAISMVFFVGLALGFLLGRTL
jgi:ABC-type dipeptide/oligopeptide/nickel transport system permease component